MSTPALVTGSNLTGEQRREVLRMFVYRWTHENMARVPANCRPTIPPVSDAQWVADHAFYIRKDGKLALRPGYAEPAYMAT